MNFEKKKTNYQDKIDPSSLYLMNEAKFENLFLKENLYKDLQQAFRQITSMLLSIGRPFLPKMFLTYSSY